MANLFILTSLLAIFYGLVVFGHLTTKPVNQFTALWVPTFMNCSSSFGSNATTWFFIPANQTVNVTLAIGSKVNPSFSQVYNIEQPTTYVSNLIILRPNASGGTFICADYNDSARAELVVDFDLRPSTNAYFRTPIIGDVITWTCQAVYLGNPFFLTEFIINRSPTLPPKINYLLFDSTTISQLEISNSKYSATATFYEIASCLSNQPTQCIARLGQPIVNLLPDAATNAWNQGPAVAFNLVRVSCEPSITGAASGDALHLGATLTCHLTEKLSVNYSWTDLTFGNSSMGSELSVWHAGSYQCNASFDIRGRHDSVSKTVSNLTVQIGNLSCTATPLHGPIAGGTKVTLTIEGWTKEIAYISAVYLGGNIKVADLQSGSSNNSVVVTTPNATTALIGQPLHITIEFDPGPYNRSSNLSFTYRDNPEISAISPSTFVFTGGTIVNVTGIRLSSVANPFIQVTIVVERGIERNTTTEKSLKPCEVEAENGSAMTCRMPSVNIPDDFLQVLDSLYNNRSKRDTDSANHLTAGNQFLLSRGKRNDNALDWTGPNGVDKLLVYLGFILDGYKKYENINNVLPNTQILIFSPPEINFTKDILEFDPDKDDSISIKGKHMTRGCRMVDYVVEVGANICENIDLTDNQLRCRPPKQQPQSTNNTSIYCNELVGIYIHLGYKTYQYACMKYSTRRPLALIIGLAVGLSSFVIIILLIIAIVCCCKRSRNRRNKSTNKSLDTNTSASNESHERPSDQVYSNAVYLRPTVQSTDADHVHESPTDQVYANGEYLRPTVQSIYANNEYEPPSIQLYANASELRGIDQHA